MKRIVPKTGTNDGLDGAMILLRMLTIASSLIVSLNAFAETAPTPKPADEPTGALEERTRGVASKDATKLHEGKKVLTDMTIRQNALEMALTDRFRFESHVLSQPFRLEIEIHDAVNGLGADMIDVNKIGIAKVFLINSDNVLKCVLIPAEGTLLSYRFELIDNSRRLLIHMAEPPYSTPATGEPGIQVIATQPKESVSPVAQAESAPAPRSVPAEIAPQAVVPVTTPAPKSKGYHLIAGESVNRKKLGPVVEKLTAIGIKPDIANITKEVEVFRLVVASFADSKSAELKRAQVALRTGGAFIVRDGDSYRVCAGSLVSEESAIQEQKRLASKGLVGLQIVRARVPLKLWRVTIGHYADAQEAEKSAQSLSKHGIKARIVGTGD